MPERLVAWSRGYGRYVPRFSPSRGTAIFFRLYEENLGLGRLDAPLEKKKVYQRSLEGAVIVNAFSLPEKTGK